jgi:hypothetical protein
VLLATAAGAAFAGCEAKGPPRPTCEDVSDAGTSDGPEIVPYTAITTDAQPPEAFGMEPDPGPTCTDCRQDDAYEVMTISDFEDGFAPAWFNYGEPGILLEPSQAGEARAEDGGVIPNLNPPQPWWGLQVANLEKDHGGARCGSRYALHMTGDRFSSWGGGFVTRHFIVRGDYMDRENLCGARSDLTENPNQPLDGGLLVNGIGKVPQFMPESYGTTRESATGCIFWASPVADQPSVLGFDVEDFDGISFWARRGPSGQSSIRVALVDSSVSDDLALYTERLYYRAEKARDPNAVVDPDKAGAACTRVEECCENCSVVDYLKYVPPVIVGSTVIEPARCDPVTEKRCHVPGERLVHCRPNPDNPGLIQLFDYRGTDCGLAPGPDTPDYCWTTDPVQVANSWDDDFPLCCPPTMENENPAELNGDPRYGGTECRPYIFNYDQSSGSYCYHDGEVLPEKNQNRCGEAFEASVVVHTEWRHFRISWDELRRFTPDKEPLDPKAIWQVAFYFGSGYLDTYIDDVGFYRRRPSAR